MSQSCCKLHLVVVELLQRICGDVPLPLVQRLPVDWLDNLGPESSTLGPRYRWRIMMLLTPVLFMA